MSNIGSIANVFVRDAPSKPGTSFELTYSAGDMMLLPINYRRKSATIRVNAAIHILDNVNSQIGTYLFANEFMKIDHQGPLWVRAASSGTLWVTEIEYI